MQDVLQHQEVMTNSRRFAAPGIKHGIGLALENFKCNHVRWEIHEEMTYHSVLCVQHDGIF